DEGAAIGVAVERPAEAVEDLPFMMLCGIELPQFLDADTERLRIAIFTEAKFFKQALGQRAAYPFCEERVFCMQFHARLVGTFLLAVPADAHVAGRNALNAAVLVIEDFGTREAGIDLNAEGLRLLGQPAAKVAKADDVVAVVMELLGEQEIREAKLVRF